MKIQKSTIFVNKILKINMLKIKNIKKSEIIVIIQVNIAMLHVSYVTQHIVYLKELPWCFTMDQTIIIILS